MNSTFHFAVGFWFSCLSLRDIFAVDFFYPTLFILLTTCTGNNIGILKTYILPWSETEIFFGSILHEIIAFYPKFSAEHDVMGTCIWIFRIVDSRKAFCLPFWIIGHNETNRIYHCRYTCSSLVEVFSHSRLHERHVIKSIIKRIPNTVHKHADRFRCVTSSTISTYGRHTGVIPS